MDLPEPEHSASSEEFSLRYDWFLRPMMLVVAADVVVVVAVVLSGALAVSGADDD